MQILLRQFYSRFTSIRFTVLLLCFIHDIAATSLAGGGLKQCSPAMPYICSIYGIEHALALPPMLSVIPIVGLAVLAGLRAVAIVTLIYFKRDPLNHPAGF